jgi:tetratricopeptide (TPR) repeat protein
MDLRIGGFVLERPIGKGGMSEVWLARHEGSNQPAAIKILRVATPIIRDAFAGEVRAMARIDHPGIVAVLDHGVIEENTAQNSGRRFEFGAPWLAMEYCSEGTLEGFIPASWNGLCRILQDLLAGLGAAHVRGVLHLDLKPDNVLVAGTKDLRPGRKLSDFGISDAVEGEGWVLGTPGYMAPEQFEGRRRDYGPWTDLYAFGCLAWALSTGQPPFGEDRPPEVLMMAHGELPPPRLKARIAVPEGLEAWLKKLLEKRPEHRFRSVGEALEGLALVDGQALARRVPKDWGQDSRADTRLGGLSLYGLRELPVVGYLEARRTIWGLLQQVEEKKKPGLVVLHGPSGRGRSRLARWLFEASGTFGLGLKLDKEEGIGGALKRWLGGEGLEEEEILEKLASWYPSLDLYDRELISSAIVGRGDRVAGMRSFLLACSRVPVVLWIEDAWENKEILELIGRLKESEGQLLVVLTVGAEEFRRSSYASALTSLARSSRSEWVDVSGLGPVEMDALLISWLRLSPETAAEIRRRAQGSPSFAIQLVNDQVQRGILIPTSLGLVLKEGAWLVLPEDVRAVWSERLNQLLQRVGLDPIVGRKILEVAGFCGDPVEEDEWGLGCGVLGLPFTGMAVSMRKAGILGVADPERRSLSWLQGAVRECVIQDAREAGREAEIRRGLVSVLKRKSGAQERLAEHLLALGSTQEALDALMQTVKELQRQGDKGGALKALEKARSLGLQIPEADRRRGELALLQSDLLHSEGDYEGARVAAEAAVALARRFGWQDVLLSGLVELADASRVRGKPSLAMGFFQEARELARTKNDRRVAGKALAGLGELAGQFGELGQAMQLLQQALKLFELEGDRRLQADCLRELGDTARRAGQLDTADGWINKALELYRNPTVPSGVAASTNIQAAIARQGGRPLIAEGLATRSLRMFEALESRQVVYPLCNLGLIFAQTERPQEARNLLERAIGLMNKQGRKQLEGWGHALILPAVAALNDLMSWDHHFALAVKGIEESDLIDPDIAEALSLGAKRVREPKRASAAWELARSQWLALGFSARVAEANAALVRLG